LLERQERDGRVRQPWLANKAEDSLGGAFFWLCAFWFVYCARPEDFIPGLKYIPLAKITGLFTLIALLSSAGKTKRSLRDLPREGRYLIVLTCFLVATSVISPVWRTGALLRSLDLAKGTVAWVLVFLLVTTFQRLRRIIFIQAASVAMVATVSVLKGHNTPRLEGVLNGMYFNANDLAFALVLSLPFCLAFFLQARGFPRKAVWMVGMMFMGIALVLTASRAGFVCLLISGSVMLWHFGVKGKRPQLILGTFVVAAILLMVAGGRLKDRFVALSGQADVAEDQSAYGSYLQRKELMIAAVRAIGRYPVYGLGVGNFTSWAGYWREVHNSYLEMGAEGGVPALVLYLLFFARGFANLKQLRKRRDLEPHVKLFVGALHSSLVGFVVGALFEPEAYQLFSYIAVAQTSVILAIIQDQTAGKLVLPGLSKLSLSGRRTNTDRISSESSPNPVVR
jgi:O-antigen ligase